MQPLTLTVDPFGTVFSPYGADAGGVVESETTGADPLTVSVSFAVRAVPEASVVISRRWYRPGAGNEYEVDWPVTVVTGSVWNVAVSTPLTERSPMSAGSVPGADVQNGTPSTLGSVAPLAAGHRVCTCQV